MRKRIAVFAGPARSGFEVAHRDYAIDRNWHFYRVEIQGSQILVSIDGARILSVPDDRYPEPGEVGLWCDRAKIIVQSFRLEPISSNFGAFYS